MEHYHKNRFPKSLYDFNSDKEKFQNSFNSNPKITSTGNFKVKSVKDQQRTYYTSTNIEETKNLQNNSKKSKQQTLSQSSQSQNKTNSVDQHRRNRIYDNEACKQMIEDANQNILQTNNKIFQMVFLNQPKLKESLSTSASFSKIKNPLKQHNFLDIHDFCLGKKIGSGKFGQVFIARHIKSGFICALKRINKHNIDHKLLIQLIRQIKIQSHLNHPNIVKLYTFFADQKFIFLVMELCYSGQLYSFLKKKKKLPENLTKIILKDTLKALDYMHERQIIHRDLKPQNIIFHSGMIKICDFGWSISSKTMRQTFCGTPLYVSPELLKRKNYNNKIDVWSIGILTYQLLFGKVPFDIATQRDFIKIVQDQIKFSKATKISDQAKQFILICLKKDPRDRYTVAELIQHPFVTNIQHVQAIQML